jgi:hypothetical protein
VTTSEPTVEGTVSASVAVPGPVPLFLMMIVYVIGWPTMYEVVSAVLVCVNTGLAPALMVGVEADPPPHCVEQPGVVGDTVAVFVTFPEDVTTPLTVYVATAPAGSVMVPATVLPLDPVVVHVPVPVAEQVTPTDPIVDGTGSLIVAVPGPVPVFVTVSV